MILHLGPDGGLHDAVGTNLLAVLAYVALGVNAILYWVRSTPRSPSSTAEAATGTSHPTLDRTIWSR